MLQALSIKNFTIIDAIEFALGNRRTNQLLRHHAKRAEVSLTLTLMEASLHWLETQELDHEQDCVIRRTLNAEGRSRSTINVITAEKLTVPTLIFDELAHTEELRCNAILMGND